MPIQLQNFEVFWLSLFKGSRKLVERGCNKIFFYANKMLDLILKNKLMSA